MLMSGLTRRLQVLVTDEDFACLEQRAKARGESIATVVREAIAHEMRGTDAERRQAAANAVLGASTPDDGSPEPEWSDLKRPMLDRWGAPPA